MKVLILDEEFPYPLNTGKRIRTFNLFRCLADRHDMTCLAYGEEDSESFRALENAGLHPAAIKRQPRPKSGVPLYVRLFGNLFSKEPYSVSSHWTNAFRQAVERELEDNNYDLVIAEWTPYAQFMRGLTKPKTLVVAHNVEYQIWQRYVENETHPVVRRYMAMQADRMKKFEEKVFRSVSGATAVSSSDADLIRTINPDLPVEVVDNGVDLDFFKPKPHPGKESAPSLVFTGSMDWRPNQDSVEYFVKEILPLIKTSHADVRTVLVGRNPPPRIVELGKHDGVTVTGTVDDVRPYIEQADVYIVPLRIGGGSRLKILEAMAMSKAVVSTSVGAEGLDVTDGLDILIADTPEQFSAKVEQLLNDKELAATLGSNGRKLVERRYGWPALAYKLDRFMQRLVVD